MSSLLLLASFFDVLEPIAKWLSIGLLATFLIVSAILLIVKKDIAGKIIKLLFKIFVFYVLIIGIVLLVSNIIAEFNKASLDDNGLSLDVVYYVFLPILLSLIAIFISALSLIIIEKKKPYFVKTMSAIVLGIVFVCVTTCLILIYCYYKNNTEDWYKYNDLALWVGSLLLVLLVIVASLFLDKKGNLSFNTKCLTMAGVCLALSFVLSYIKLFDPPTGGSITLASLFPVMLFAYVYGMKKGLLVGFIYGVLQAVQEPWLVHPAQFLLDYPIAFSMVGLAGIFNNFNILKKLPWLKFSIGAIIAVSFRFVSSVIAGIFAWEANLSASLLINSVILLDVILVLAVGIALFLSKSFVREIDKLNPLLDND